MLKAQQSKTGLLQKLKIDYDEHLEHDSDYDRNKRYGFDEIQSKFDYFMNLKDGNLRQPHIDEYLQLQNRNFDNCTSDGNDRPRKIPRLNTA